MKLRSTPSTIIELQPQCGLIVALQRYVCVHLSLPYTARYLASGLEGEDYELPESAKQAFET